MPVPTGKSVKGRFFMAAGGIRMEDMHYEEAQRKREEQSFYTRLADKEEKLTAEQVRPQPAFRNPLVQKPSHYEPRRETDAGMNVPLDGGKEWQTVKGPSIARQEAVQTPGSDMQSYLENVQGKMRAWKGDGFSFSPAESEAFKRLVGASANKDQVHRRGELRPDERDFPDGRMEQHGRALRVLDRSVLQR